MRRFGRLSILLLLLFALCVPLSVVAQEGVNRAGVIVVFDEGEVWTDCVAFEGELTGYELLERTGLSVVVKDYGGGLGSAICKIGDVGCDYPAENCFCRVDGTSWRYWYWEDGGWVYSGSGASNRIVGDGDVDAWIWGMGEREPPDLDFGVLCASPTETPTETPTNTYTPTPEPATPTPTVSHTPTLSRDDEATRTPRPTLDNTDTPLPTATCTATPTHTPTPSSVPPTATSTPNEDHSEATSTSTRTGEGEIEPAGHSLGDSTSDPTVASRAGTASEGEEGEISDVHTPTPDKVAMRIATSVTQNRPTPAPVAGQEGQRGNYGIFALLAIVLLVINGYVTLLRRQSDQG